jgi:hypothetical protein
VKKSLYFNIMFKMVKKIVIRNLVLVKEFLKRLIGPFPPLVALGTLAGDLIPNLEAVQKSVNKKRGEIAQISAILRVKNGVQFIEAQILNILPMCTEIIVIDNSDDSECQEIVRKCSERYVKTHEIKYYVYKQAILPYGKEYSERLAIEPDKSIAKFYNYCFSLGTKEYLWKVDLNNLYSLGSFRIMQKAIEKKPDVLYIEGVEVCGRKVSSEPRLYRRELGLTYKDGDQWEYLNIERRDEIKECRIFRPLYLHARALFVGI